MATSPKHPSSGAHTSEGAGAAGRRGRQAASGGQGVGSPISNEAYNVISALHAKLEGLEAYRKYAKDATGDLWRDLTQIEVQSIERLVQQLERLVQDGKLRMHAPGEAH